MPKLLNLKTHWLAPLAVLIIGFALSLLLWQQASHQQIALIKKSVSIQADLTKTDISKSIQSNLLALKRMADRWQVKGGTPYAQWQRDAKNYVKDQPGLTTVEWVDDSYYIRWIEPEKGNEKAKGLYILYNEERTKSLVGASEKGSITLTSPLDLIQGYKAFIAYVPVYVNGRFDGFIAGIFNIEEVLRNYLGDLYSNEFHIQFSINNIKAFENNVSSPVRNDLLIEETFPVNDTIWSIKLTPTEAFIKKQSLHLPTIFFACGMFVTILVSLIAYFLQLARANAKNAKKSKERFELVVDGTNEGIWDIPDINQMDNMYWSSQLKRLLGYKDDEIIPSTKSTQALLHPDDKDAFNNAIYANINNDTPFDLEYRMMTKSGDYRWFRGKASTIRDDLGTAVRMVGSMSDITFQKANEETIFEFARELQNSQRRLETIFNNVLDGIITIDTSGIIHSFNPTAEKLFGYASYEVVGKNIKMLMPRHIAIEHDHYLQRYLQTEQRHIIGKAREVEAMRKDGSTFIMELGVTELELSDERLFTGVVRDISDRKKAEAELIQAKEQAEEGARLKSEFLANMSHEIRTPMNGIIGMTNLLMETDLDHTQLNYAKTAVNSAENLLQLVNDILDFSKIEAGKLEMEYIPFDLIPLIEEVADLIAVKAHEKGLEVLLQIPANLPSTLIGDPGRLRQILLNLTSNALKFTEKGHILIALKSHEIEKSDKIKLYCSIEDTGIGIPEDKTDYIFDKFSQADGSTTRKFGGTGLGLSICKELVSNMNGEIGVESTLGEGSTFWFNIELEKNTEQKVQIEEANINLKDLKILLLDHNEKSRHILKKHLKQYDSDLETAKSSTELLNLIKNTRHNSIHDYIIISAPIPDMDYLELAENIRKKKPYKDTHIIMLTSTPQRGDIEHVKTAGYNAYLVKPISGHDIIKTISRFEANKQATNYEKNLFITRHTLREYDIPATENAVEIENFKGSHILLTEDNPTNLAVATTILEGLGCRVTTALNGLEAINLYQNDNFDLIFMDCNMPEMDGFEATQKIREYEQDIEKEQPTPIIAFTAYAMKGDDKKCYDAGMDDYLTKPVKKPALISILQKWLTKKIIEKSKPQPSVEPNAPKEDTVKTIRKTAPKEDVNFDTLHELMDLMGDKFEKMANLYIEKSLSYIETAHKAIKDNNAQAFTDVTHALKSSSASFGFFGVSSLSGTLENSSRDILEEKSNEDLSTLAKDLEALEKKLHTAREILNQEMKTIR